MSGWQDIYASAAHDACIAAAKALKAITPQERFEAALRNYLGSGASFEDVELCVGREALRRGQYRKARSVVLNRADESWSPTHYTSWEGDAWRAWPEKNRCLSIYSIRFDNGAEFDILNGWRWPVAPGSFTVSGFGRPSIDADDDDWGNEH